MIQWSEELCLGIEAFDEQHRRLLEIAAEAEELLRDRLRLDKYDKIVEILTELKDYTVYHFQAEEAFMADQGYVRLLSHKVEHDDFVAKINDVDLTAIDEAQDQYLLGLLDFIAQWIVDHIMSTDRQYADQLAGH